MLPNILLQLLYTSNLLTKFLIMISILGMFDINTFLFPFFFFFWYDTYLQKGTILPAKLFLFSYGIFHSSCDICSNSFPLYSYQFEVTFHSIVLFTLNRWCWILVLQYGTMQWISFVLLLMLRYISELKKPFQFSYLILEKTDHKHEVCNLIKIM